MDSCWLSSPLCFLDTQEAFMCADTTALPFKNHQIANGRLAIRITRTPTITRHLIISGQKVQQTITSLIFTKLVPIFLLASRSVKNTSLKFGRRFRINWLSTPISLCRDTRALGGKRNMKNGKTTN